MQKPKRTNKSKEQLVNEMKLKQNFRPGTEVISELRKDPKFVARLKFTKEVFMPALIKASVSVDDAKTFLSSISTVIMQKFLEEMKKKKFSELNLTDGLDPNSPKYEEVKALLDLFKDESIFDARTSIEGMVNEINVFIDDELKGRTLESLKMEWIDERYEKRN